jgi:hypothetical protein
MAIRKTAILSTENDRRIFNQAFDKWRQAHFLAEQEEKIAREVQRELLAGKYLHAGDLWIIKRTFLAAQLKKNQPQPSEWPFPDLQKVCTAIETIKTSRFSFVLNPLSEEVLRLGAQDPKDRATVEKLIKHRLQSKKAGVFVPALALLDAYPTTKPTNYVEGFFAYLISGWFKRTKRKRNWKLVSKIIDMCFGASMKRTKAIDPTKKLEQGCREFIAKFPNAAVIAEAVYKVAINSPVVDLTD